MRKFYSWVVDHRKTVMVVFLVAAVLGLLLKGLVSVNYDMNDYLPEDSPSTVALDVMEGEFDGGIPNARVMIRNVTIPEALEYKEKLEAVEGVTAVTWLDDTASIYVPLSSMDPEVVETYYKDGNALFSVTIEEDSRISAVADIRELIGDGNALAGAAASVADCTTNTISEIQKIAALAMLIILFILVMTTRSWWEPVLILVGLGVAVAINAGTNLMFGEISFVTNAAGSILQLAVSLDYSVFLIHRFEECRLETDNARDAMVEALCRSTSSILSSGLTTVIGFLALVLMQFRIGPDLGLVLAKGIAFSLITVFVFMPVLVLSTYKLLDKTRHRPFLPSFKKFGRFVRRIAVPMVCVFALLLVPAYLASNSNSYYFGASHVFGPTSRLGMDTAAIDDVFGESDTYVLMVPKGDTATETELSHALHDLPHVTGVISYVDMAGAEVPMEYLDADTLSQLVSDHYSRMVLSVDVPSEGDETFELVEQVRSTAQQYYPGAYHLAGEGVSTYDLMDTVTADMVKVNLVAIAAVFIVLLLTLKSVFLPAILVVSIEAAIWLNLATPYFMDSRVFYVAYLIISSIQLGSTVDYAILMTDRYRENRRSMGKREAVVETVSNVTVSILTSGIALTVVGMLMGYISSNQILSQLGIFFGRGAIFSLIIVLFVLPGLLYLFDNLIIKQKDRHQNKREELAK